jgi:hypothetical protein
MADKPGFRDDHKKPLPPQQQQQSDFEEKHAKEKVKPSGDSPKPHGDPMAHTIKQKQQS